RARGRQMLSATCRRPPRSALWPYTTRFRSKVQGKTAQAADRLKAEAQQVQAAGASLLVLEAIPAALGKEVTELLAIPTIGIGAGDRKSTRLNSCHVKISYAVFRWTHKKATC